MTRIAIRIFLCGFCLAWAVRGVRPHTIDELLPLYSAVSLIDHADFNVPMSDFYNPFFLVTRDDGRLYPKFGPGQAVILAPLAALGRLAALCGVPGEPVIRIAMFFGSLAVPLIGVLAFLLWVRLGFSKRASAICALAMVATSELLPYSSTLFGDVSCALLSFAAFYMIGSLGESSRWGALTAGACLGLAVLVRPVTVIFAAPYTLYLVLVWKRTGVSAGARMRHLSCGLLSFSICAGLLLAYNRLAYGSALASGYGDEMFSFTQTLVHGIPHILISFEKGFFVYSPTVILSLVAWRHFHRRHPAESWTAMLLAVLYVYVYASWYASEPGTELSYGQRFLLPVVPFAYLALPSLVERIHRPAHRAMLWVVLGFSFLAQMGGSLIRDTVYRPWSSQFETLPPTWMGHILMTIESPEHVAFWWWNDGVGILSGTTLLVLSVWFAATALGQSGAADSSGGITHSGGFS